MAATDSLVSCETRRRARCTGLGSGRTLRRELDDRRSRYGQASFPDRRHRRDRRRGRRVRRRTVPGVLEAQRPRESHGRAGRSGHQQARAGRDAQDRVARQGGLRRAPHAADAGPARRRRRPSCAIRSRRSPTSRSSPGTPRARSSPSTWCSSASARTSVARRSTSSRRATSRSRADWQGGFFCPCHGSKFDISGRVFKNVPAPTNLPVPPYQFVTDTRILIGAEKGNA